MIKIVKEIKHFPTLNQPIEDEAGNIKDPSILTDGKFVWVYARASDLLGGLGWHRTMRASDYAQPGSGDQVAEGNEYTILEVLENGWSVFIGNNGQVYTCQAHERRETRIPWEEKTIVLTEGPRLIEEIPHEELDECRTLRYEAHGLIDGNPVLVKWHFKNTCAWYYSLPWRSPVEVISDL